MLISKSNSIQCTNIGGGERRDRGGGGGGKIVFI